MASTRLPKEIALHFLKLCSEGKSREAFALYVGPGFKHHNIYFKGDAESLMIAMEENAQKTPEKTFEVMRTLWEGELVAVHSHVCPQPGVPGVAVVHILRFEDSRIVELWDLGQPIPTEMVNENGIF
ncbi:MAG: polyketide cyclase [Bacteroidetes bacterium RIFCSPHIGHO2_02_FULL_44_7]|nr:MAG: polyketide cyclase [Bacteroidetes bacterium RIFCSPHIGHO2_02_FULL_44_7]